MNDGGFEVLGQARKENALAAEQALREEADRLGGGLRGGLREGIPLELWRALPDSPGEQ